MNKKVLIIVIIAVAVISISAAVYTISPLFISNTVNEPLPNITTTTTTTNSVNQKAASLEYQKFISMNQQDIMNTAKQMNQNKKNMIIIGVAQVNNTVNENIDP